MRIAKFPVFIMALILIVIIFGLVMYITQYSTKKVTTFFENDATKITRINIMDGNNGNITTIDDRKAISDISSYLASLELKKFKDEPSGGWSYRVSVFEEDKEVFNITFNGDVFCTIDGTKYNIEKSSDFKIESLKR